MNRLELISSKEYWVEYLEMATKNGITDFDMAQDIVNKMEEALLIQGVSKRYDEMIFKPPFRIGRKQGKAVLDANGLLVTFFEKSESQASLFCDYLNR